VNRPHITEKSTLDDKNINPPMFDVPLVVLLLLGFLVLIHVLLNQLGSEGQAIKEGILAFNPERFLGEAALAQLPGSKWWSFLTSGFVHADWAHLGFNSIWLLIFGTPVARVLGSGRFLLLAGLSIIGGSAAILASYWGERISLLGASGGVAGLTAAAIPLCLGSVEHARVMSLNLWHSTAILTASELSLSLQLCCLCRCFRHGS
jgi:membrane associated rhomboid family serine protease